MYDLTYPNIIELQCVYGSKIKFGWTIVPKGTYYVTTNPKGVRCQFWDTEMVRNDLQLALNDRVN